MSAHRSERTPVLPNSAPGQARGTSPSSGVSLTVDIMLLHTVLSLVRTLQRFAEAKL